MPRTLSSPGRRREAMWTYGSIFLTELRVSHGSRDWRWVRWELFVFRDVRDVLPTADADIVLVVHRGPAQLERWREALRDSGLDGRPAGSDGRGLEG